MAHDNKVFKNTSWGRTRQAKNLRGDNTLETTTSTDDPSAVTDGFATEGQRFLHMFLHKDTAAALTITVYGLTYAFGGASAQWYQVQDGGSSLTISANNSTVVVSGEDKIDITGIDRLFFKVTTGAVAAADNFYAAANTLPVNQCRKIFSFPLESQNTIYLEANQFVYHYFKTVRSQKTCQIYQKELLQTLKL